MNDHTADCMVFNWILACDYWTMESNEMPVMISSCAIICDSACCCFQTKFFFQKEEKELQAAMWSSCG
jgi:hypothetical protein